MEIAFLFSNNIALAILFSALLQRFMVLMIILFPRLVYLDYN